MIGFLLSIDIYKENKLMKKIKYHLDLGATTSCTKKIMEATKELGQRGIKGDTKDFFICENWFVSKRSDKAAMGVGADMVGMILTNTKGLFKDTI